MRRVLIGLVAFFGLLLAVLAPAVPAHAAGSTVSGTITVPAGFDVTDVTVQIRDEDWDVVFTTSPDNQGDFTFADVPNGEYQIQASGDGMSTERSAWFMVNADVAGKNLTLREIFTVSGSVSSSAGPVTEGYVEFFASCDDWEDDDSAAYDYFEDQPYSVDLPTGSYRVRIVVYSGLGLSSWHNAKSSCLSADVVAVNGDQTLNLVTLPSGQIRGTVRYNGVGVSDSWVVAYRWDQGDESWDYYDDADTANDGSYTLSRLTPGTYKVQFGGYYSATLSLSGQWWNGAATLAAATQIPLASGQTVNGIDANLQKAASISGVVTGPNGARKNVDVTVFDSASGEAVDDTSTALDGSWKIQGLEPGTYYLRFQEEGGVNREFWNDKATVNTADTFTLTVGQDLTGLNAWLGSPDPCEFQNNCPVPPPPPPPPPADQTLKMPAKSIKKGKTVKLASRTTQGSKVTWKASPTKVCKIKKKKSAVSLGTLKKGKCKLTAGAPAVSGYNPLSSKVTIKVK